jgi:hypothetical protein
MAVLYNFTNVYAIAFAFNALASYIQNRRDQHLRSINDETTLALESYSISGAFVAQRKKLLADTQRSVRRIRLFSLLTYTIVMVDCSLALFILIFSGLHPTYELSNLLFIIIIIVLLLSPVLTWLLFSFCSAYIMKQVRWEIDEVVRAWEAAGLNKKGVIDISVLARRWRGGITLQQDARHPIVEFFSKYLRLFRKVNHIELDTESSDILSKIEYDYGTDPEETASTALAFLEYNPWCRGTDDQRRR